MTTRPMGNHSQFDLTSATEKVVTVGRHNRATVSVVNPSGANTFDIIGYSMSAEQATRRGLTRRKHILELGVTDASYTKVTTGPMEEVGVEITTYVSGTVNVDIDKAPV